MMLLSGPQVSYGAACVLGDVCATDNAACRQGKCQCLDGFGVNSTGTVTTCGLFLFHLFSRYFTMPDFQMKNSSRGLERALKETL